MPAHPMQSCRSAQAPDPSRPLADLEREGPSQGGLPADLLFRGRQEILIDHHGEIYRLRITRNDKLILTK